MILCLTERNQVGRKFRSISYFRSRIQHEAYAYIIYTNLNEREWKVYRFLDNFTNMDFQLLQRDQWTQNPAPRENSAEILYS